MKWVRMTAEEMKEYYGKNYRKIINFLGTIPSEFIFEVDTDCYRYLEVRVIKNNNHKLTVNHGISNTKPYNVWYSGSTSFSRWKYCRTQDEAVKYMEECFGMKKNIWW